MGVGYSVSPLHRIIYFEPDPNAPPPEGPPGYVEQLLAQYAGRPAQRAPPARFVSSSMAEIVAWRDGIASKYRDQLGELLTWDEESDFALSEDTFTSGDMLFRYVAAVLDQRGREAAARALVGSTKPPLEVSSPVFAEAERRSFAGRFPQLLLGAQHWLPYKRHLIIEEPHWRGDVERFGSTERLAEEVAEVRAFIAAADPKAAARDTRKLELPEDVLAAAWQASDTISRLCAEAVARHLPMWTTG